MNISENNIYLGDAYELIKSVPDNIVDCVYTDIPYLYAHTGGGHSHVARNISRKAKQLKEISNGIDYSILDEFARVCKKVNVFIWCSKMQILDIMTWGKDYNTEILTWCKTNPTPSTNNVWLPDIEYCLYFREKGVLLNNVYELKSKFYISPANVDDKRKFEHPTIKPLPLVQKHILHTTKVGGGNTRSVFRKRYNSRSV